MRALPHGKARPRARTARRPTPREIYQRMRARPAPAVYRPSHGGLAGIIRAHSLDAQLMARDGVYAGMFRRQASGYA